jgi:hypothetical protein
MGDLFDLLNADGTEVEEQRVLRDPGATAGDVLTVNADKTISAAPGGGSLPTGWTQDANNPATVNTNGGFLRFGSDGGVVVPNAGFIVSDSNVSFAVNGDLDMGSQAITGLQAPTTDSEPATKSYVDRRTLAADESVQYIAAQDADTQIVLQNTGGVLSLSGFDDTHTQTFQLTSGGALYLADGAGGLASVFVLTSVPVIPAIPTPQDIVDALVTLGLVTQAA